MLTTDRLHSLMDRFSAARIAVLGDFFLDKYLEVDPGLAETSVETGKVAHQVVEVRCSPGAAGTVVNNLVSLRAGHVATLGVIGDDGEGYSLRKELLLRECDVAGLVESSEVMTPTYLKPRNRGTLTLDGEHSRYDTKNRRPMPETVTAALIAELERRLPDWDAVIIADQVEADDCGVVTAALRSAIASLARLHPEVIFWADSRRRIRRFRNVIIKPNQFEAVGHESPQPGDTVSQATLEEELPPLWREIGGSLVVTRGEAGAVVFDGELTVVPGVRLSGPLDTTGAGDSVTAGAVLALAAGATLPEATLVGMLAASITVQQLATTGVARPDELLERLRLWQEQQPR